MTIDDMIAVLDAAQRGEWEKIEIKGQDGKWYSPPTELEFNLPMNRYRIAPKKEMSLVSELRHAAESQGLHMIPFAVLLTRAADRISELEKECRTWKDFSTDELLAELKRRTT